MKKYPVVHFEMPANDRERMSKFYTEAFGWETEQLGEEMGNYVVVTTTETDPVSKHPKEPGSINGGFYDKPNDGSMSQTPSLVIAVDDIKEHVKAVEKAGGTILGEPQEIPGIGLYVTFIDTEGNRLSMLQPRTPM